MAETTQTYFPLFNNLLNSVNNFTAGNTFATTSGNFGVGTLYPLNKFSIQPLQYNTGTASQSASTITGVGTNFTSALIGSIFTFADGTNAGIISAVGSTTSLTVSTSQTITTQSYSINYIGLQLTSTGLTGINVITPLNPLDVARTSLTANSENIIARFLDINGGSNAIAFAANTTVGSAIVNMRIRATGANPISIGTSGSNDALFIANSGNIGIGTTILTAPALLNIVSTTKGVLLPRMTTAQKNAIISPVEGLEVYDLTLHKKCVFTGSVWETITSA